MYMAVSDGSKLGTASQLVGMFSEVNPDQTWNSAAVVCTLIESVEYATLWVMDLLAALLFGLSKLISDMGTGTTQDTTNVR